MHHKKYNPYKQVNLEVYFSLEKSFSVYRNS